MEAKYELKKGKILKDGHTMFFEDVVMDLNRKSYLESLTTTKEPRVSEEEFMKKHNLQGCELCERYADIELMISNEDCYICQLCHDKIIKNMPDSNPPQNR